MPTTIVITVDGNDITDDVIIQNARFDYATDGNIGNAQVKVRDMRGGPYVPGYFKVGQEMTLDVGGKRVWGGYVMKVTRTYPFPATENEDPDTEERYWVLDGNDYNILLRRRKLYDKTDPIKQMKEYNQGDTDKQIISDMCNLYLDLDGDGFQAGTGDDVINLDNVIELGELYWVANCSEAWQAASPGMDWADGMRSVVDWSGGVFYIGPATPDQSFKGPVFYYHDVNSATGPYELNDRPASDPGSAGVRNFTYVEDATELATEALVWGAGQGSQDMVFWRETATSEQSTYGTWQWGDFHQSMYEEECVKHRAKTYIHGSRLSKRGHKTPKDSWDVTIFKPDFLVGDVVDVHSYVHNVTDTVPIRRYQVTFPTHEEAQFDLHLSHYYDTAFATYMWWEQPAPAGPWHEEAISIGDYPHPGALAIGGRLIFRHYKGASPSISKLKDEPLDFLGYEGHRIGSSFIHSYKPWYGDYWGDPNACCGISLGIWHDETWCHNQMWLGLPALNTATEAQLFIDGFEFGREGKGGVVDISVVSDFDYVIDGNDIVGGGYASAFDAHTDGAVAPGTLIESVDISGPIRDDARPAYGHFYSGNWGSYNQAPSIIIPGQLLRTAQSAAGYNNPSNIQPPRNWLVFTSPWVPTQFSTTEHRWCPDGACCDYGIAKGQGPCEQGHGGSGGSQPLWDHFTGMTYGEGNDYWWINPFNETDPTLDQNEFGDGRYYSPSPDANGYFYTRYPYIPGTLQVSINGRSLVLGTEYWETNPAIGQFRVNVQGSPTGMQVRYKIADPTASPHPGWGGYYDPGEIGGGHYQDVPNGRYYRPVFRSQLGWGTQWDGYNCTPAACCHFIDRSTHGAKKPTPPQVNSAMQSIGVWRGTSGASINDAAAVNRQVYGQYVLNPGIVSLQQFINLLAEGRGAQLTGNSNALKAWDLHARSEYTGQPFTGFHALYVNEVRSDGYFFVYDSAFRVNSKYGITPGWYPAAAIQAYASARSGSTQRVWAIYTRKTPKL